MPRPDPNVERASAWPANLIGKRGRRTDDPELYIRRDLELAIGSYISFGSVSASVYRNTANRPPNARLPTLERVGPGYRGAGDDAEDVCHIEIPRQYAHLRRMVVPLGKFGLADDFSFADHNLSTALTALDNTVPNCYCNVVLLMLYELPWIRAHCLSSLSRSQFALSDELGFLFSMMDRSAGAACQPRNFQRALKQSREATALKLVDAVDLEVGEAAAMRAAALPVPIPHMLSCTDATRSIPCETFHASGQRTCRFRRTAGRHLQICRVPA